MEFTTKATGAKVVVNAADLQDAFLLKTKIQKAFKENGINPVEALGKGDVFSLIDAMDGSMDVFDGLFTCLKKSTYNGAKITPEVFMSEETRGDLYEIFFYCLKVNVYPFFKSLSSLLSTQSAKTED